MVALEADRSNVVDTPFVDVEANHLGRARLNVHVDAREVVARLLIGTLRAPPQLAPGPVGYDRPSREVHQPQQMRVAEVMVPRELDLKQGTRIDGEAQHPRVIFTGLPCCLDVRFVIPTLSQPTLD